MDFIKYRKSTLYDRLVDEYEIFEHSYDLMIFLAVLGYKEGSVDREQYKGRDDDGTRGQIGMENFFANDLYRVVASCIAFQDTDDPAALADPEIKAEKIAQYASGGLEIAEEEFGQTAGDPTDAIVNYLNDCREQEETYQGTLGEIVKAFDEEFLDV